MKKKIPNWLVAMIVVVLLFSFVFIIAGGYRIRFNSDYIYQICNKDGHKYICLTKYIGKKSNVVIPEHIGKYTVEETDDAFRDNDYIVSVTIPNTVTRMHGWVFAGCDNLKSVKLSDSLEIIDGFFVDCSSLEMVSLSAKADFIAYNAFDGCYKLKNVTCSGYTLFAEGPKFCSGTYRDIWSDSNTGLFHDCPNVLLNGKPVPINASEYDATAFIDPATNKTTWR